MKKIMLSMALCCYGLLGHTQSEEMVEELNKPFPNFSVLETEADKYYRDLDPEEMTDEEKSFTKHFARWYSENRFYTDENFTLAKKRSSLINLSGSQYYYCAGYNANWSPLGPTDKVLDSSNGYYNGMGRIDAVTVNPFNKNDVIIASSSGGLWRTTNGGSSWTNVTGNLKLPFLEFKGIARNPHNPDFLLACTGAGKGEKRRENKSNPSGTLSGAEG